MVVKKIIIDVNIYSIFPAVSSFLLAKLIKLGISRSILPTFVFNEFDFLHHDIQSEALFCNTCHRYIGMLPVKLGKQKQRAKCWYNRSKFEQNSLS